MYKKIFILLTSASLCASEQTENSSSKIFTKIAMGTAIAAGIAATTVVCGPAIVATGTVVVTQIAAGSLLSKISLSSYLAYSGGKWLKRSYYPSHETQLEQLEKKNSRKIAETKNTLRECLIRNKSYSANNIPTPCGQAAYLVEMLAGQPEIDKIITELNR